jgi:hypothetical protein
VFMLTILFVFIKLYLKYDVIDRITENEFMF